MKLPTTAVLLSALVAPGAGHFYLKKHLVGGLLLALALIAIATLVSTALDQAFLISDQISAGTIQPDVATITEQVKQHLSNAKTENVNIATYTFIIVWIIGVIDSYRIASKQTKSP